MTSATTSLALDLSPVPEADLPLLSLLPAASPRDPALSITASPSLTADAASAPQAKCSASMPLSAWTSSRPIGSNLVCTAPATISPKAAAPSIGCASCSSIPTGGLSAGLYWAARNYALAAVSSNFRKYRQSGRIDDLDPSLLSQWFECELRLGRVPYALSAYELGAMIRNGRSRTKEQAIFADKRRIQQADSLATLLIATEFRDLPRLKKLPAALDRLGLLQVSTTLLFLMGGEDALRGESAVPDDETPGGIATLFDQMAAVRRSAELPKPEYMLDNTVLLCSRVLGCEISATCENSLTSLGIAEALLGTLELLLATSLNLHTLPHLDRLAIRVQSKADTALTPQLEFIEENGSTVAVVTHRTSLSYGTREEAEGFPSWLQGSVVQIFLTFAIPNDPELWCKTVLERESGFSRAITFSNIPTMLDVLFGDIQRLWLRRPVRSR